MKHIYFVRHGETDWNKEKRSQGGLCDVPINITGRKQAAQTGKYFRQYHSDIAFDCIISSTMLRAIETVHIIANEIGYPIDNIKYDNRLIEIIDGKIGGTTEQERRSNPIFKQYMNLLDKYNDIKDPITRSKLYNSGIINSVLLELGAETPSHFEVRCKAALEDIISSKCKNIMVVCHGGVISCMGKIMTGIIEKKFPHGIYYDNMSNCRIMYATYCLKHGYTIYTLPNTEHLGFINMSGGYNKYFDKYCKYKKKYMNLKNKKLI